jgi:hypothetical protein
MSRTPRDAAVAPGTTAPRPHRLATPLAASTAAEAAVMAVGLKKILYLLKTDEFLLFVESMAVVIEEYLLLPIVRKEVVAKWAAASAAAKVALMAVGFEEGTAIVKESSLCDRFQMASPQVAENAVQKH